VKALAGEDNDGKGANETAEVLQISTGYCGCGCGR